MPKVKNMPKVAKSEEVVYPNVRTVVYCDESRPKEATGVEYNPPMDSELAKQLLGWTVEEEGVKFGDDYLFKDHTGRKVRLTNNTHNREIDMQWVKELVQNHLRKQFAFNGESIIIGRNGSILSAQHRLVSLVLAEQQRDATADQGTWDHTWGKSPVTMETVAVFGIDESPETVRTIDNVKPKSLSDILYADPELFATNKTLTNADRSVLTKMLESAVKKVRYRTHADKDAYRPRRTHAEEVTFLEIHKKIKDAVKHIWGENKAIEEKEEIPTTDKDGNPTTKTVVKRTIPLATLKINPGSAAGLLYLMAASGDTTDGDKYRNLYHVGDADKAMRQVKFDRWDAACQFWSLICDVATTPLPELRYAFAALNKASGEAGGSTAERESLIIKAWNAWIRDEELNSDNLRLEYTDEDKHGNKSLKNAPDLGGIDMGIPVKEVKSEKVEDEGSEEATEAGQPSDDNDSGMSEQEVEERKEAERLRKELAATKPDGRRKKKVTS